VSLLLKNRLIVWLIFFSPFFTAEAQARIDYDTIAEPNNLARFIAGMAVDRGSRYYSLTQGKIFKSHASEMDRLWGAITRFNLTEIRKWSGRYISPLHQERTVFYPLSGSDIINAVNIFPRSPRFVFVAMEPAGGIPDPVRLTPKQLAAGLLAVRQVMITVGQVNYLFSRRMEDHMHNVNLTGAFPILLAFLARYDLRVLDLSATALNSDGQVVFSPQASHPVSGAYIRFENVYGNKSELFYFSMKISGQSASLKTPEGKYFHSLGTFNTILKSAIYLMHYEEYQGFADFLIGNSDCIVQDDSGIPFRLVPVDRFDSYLFGAYGNPVKIYHMKVFIQNDLAAEYKKNRAIPISFQYGYSSWRGKGKSNVQVFIRKGSRL